MGWRAKRDQLKRRNGRVKSQIVKNIADWSNFTWNADDDDGWLEMHMPRWVQREKVQWAQRKRFWQFRDKAPLGRRSRTIKRGT